MEHSPLTIVQRIDGQDVEFFHHEAGPDVAVVFHGGHMRASLPLGHEPFLDAAWSVIQPSRPGYGRTALGAGPSPAAFADSVAALCAHLGIQQVCAVGISAGGRSAMALAARHPDLVRGLVLESAVSSAPWPGRGTRAVAHVVFNGATERATWALVRAGFRWLPTLTLAAIISSLSALPTRGVMRNLSPGDCSDLAELLSQMRSGRGFVNDLRAVGAQDRPILAPTLVVQSRHDRAVGAEHTRAIAEAIPHADVVWSDALTHLLWFGPHRQIATDAVRDFIAVLPRR